MAEKSLPHRSTGGLGSDDEAVPDVDPSDTSGLLLERLQAWKHACGYLEDYISATEKVEKAHAKEYEKVLKTISDPLKQGHHFDQSLGGVAGLFENMRSNTQGIANSHLETEKNLKGSVLPILGRLHAEIKHKSKELSGGAAKGSKSVDKARNTTQKHIELLGQHTAAVASAGGKVDAADDPYLIQRGIKYRLGKQVLEENNNRRDLIAVQDSFQKFEAHVIQTIQQAMSAFLQQVGGQAERQKVMYSEMNATTQRIPLDFEWHGFVQRNGTLLIDPATPQRDISRITYPNQDHPSTQPLITGTLERKSRALGALKGFSPGYFAITPSKYLHEFKEDDDDVRKDPTPELSLYLPDCVVGSIDGTQFHVKGKNASHGKVGGVLATSHEYIFRAQTPADAEKWWNIIREMAGSTGEFAASEPNSPIESRNDPGEHPPPQYQDSRHVAPVQTQGLPQTQAGQMSGTTTSTGGYGTGSVPTSAIPTQQPYNTPNSAGGLQDGSAGAHPAAGGAPNTSGVPRAPGQY